MRYGRSSHGARSLKTSRAPVTRSRRPPREITGQHVRSNTRLYEIWKGAKRRCTSPSCKDYPDYGGRGITMCKEWLENFDAFLDLAWDHGYNPERSLEREDVDKGYSQFELHRLNSRPRCLGTAGRPAGYCCAQYTQDASFVNPEITVRHAKSEWRSRACGGRSLLLRLIRRAFQPSPGWPWRVIEASAPWPSC